jgi:hypothetical protein
MTQEKPKVPLLTSRQLASAAVFGGLGFATRAMGLIVPIVPPLIFDLRAVFWILGVAGSGPIGAIIVGLLIGLPSAFPLASIPTAIIYGLVFCLLYKRLYYMKSSVKYLGLAIWAAVSTYLGDTVLIIVFTYVYKMYPTLMTGLVIDYTTSSVVWSLAAAIGIILFVKYAPEYAEPTWSWIRPKAQ